MTDASPPADGRRGAAAPPGAAPAVPAPAAPAAAPPTPGLVVDVADVPADGRSAGRAAVRVLVAGELDVATAPVLAERLAALPPVARLELDLAGLRFCDIVGLDVLLAVRDAAAQRGAVLVVDGSCRSLDRLRALLGLRPDLTVHADDAAGGAAPAARVLGPGPQARGGDLADR